ncbi:protein phosphatase 1 regulatory subunit 42-like isoform X1 [Apis cerana]|uniref:protein phosphatase 1 regulatory subunit 42-like isoform X1 n=1 Tax=Apis cerana TaxID=7461 RepID=UPI002B2347EC|nr:protein phosphatase 1 regulatory subunit 42-like isoform X1 [Apis cerana]XP_061930134.1 protein phosphatase 1 regulatory subunit 42-like isoform X1 [Apis cerana]
MARLTTQYIEKKCSQEQLNKALNKKIKKDQLYLTHLRMNNMFISNISNFSNYKNLKVIYLQNNNISKIENLHYASNLTHLYLQHNIISKIENLNYLEKLQTLYLGYNKILVVEGLENLKNLTVLQIENQKLPFGESLYFDPRSILALSVSFFIVIFLLYIFIHIYKLFQTCLKVLNISGNKITSLKNIKELYKLEILDATNNIIDDINDLTETINILISLKDLSLQGNPITKYYRYKENLIANNDTIKTLDGKTVTDVCRCFMKRFKMKKHLYHTKKLLNTADEDITSSLNLPPALKASISRAIFQHPDSKLSTITSVINKTQSYIYPSWKIGANIIKNGRITPKPFWNTIKIKKTKKSNHVQPILNTEIIKLPPI